MKAYQNIMVIADPLHQGSWGLQRAGQLAAASGATLHLRSFSHHPGISAIHALNAGVAELARKELMREQREWLEREADALRGSVKNVRAEVIWGTPVQDKIVSEVLALKPELVVKDVEAVPTLKRLLFTPLDWHLIRICPAPLLMVNRDPDVKAQRIVAAVDVGATHPEAEPLNAEILKAARALAGLGEAKVELVHVFEGPPALVAGAVDAGLTEPEALYKQMREDRATRFTAFADRHGVAKPQRHLVDGLPDLALTTYVQDSNADVVVLGSVNRTGLDRVLTGSTAERVLSQLHCDVLTLKPHRFREMLGRHFGIENAP